MANMMTRKLDGSIEQTSDGNFTLRAYRGELFSFAYTYSTFEKAAEAAKKYKVTVHATWGELSAR